MTPLKLRPAAEKDIDRAVDWYLSQGAEQAANDFLDALQTAFGLIGENPHIGSARYDHLVPHDEKQSACLRFWRAGGFPWLIFYFASDENIDVVRVLHGARDIPQLLCSPDG